MSAGGNPSPIRTFILLLVIVILIAGCDPRPVSQPAHSPAAPELTPTAPAPVASPTPAGVLGDNPTALPLPLPEGAILEPFPSLNDVRSLAFAPDGALWAGLGGGIVRWDLETNAPRHFTVAEGLAGDLVNDLLFARDGALWAATASGVSRYDGANWDSSAKTGGVGSAPVYSLAEAPDGTLWAGTERGLYRYDGSTWQRRMPADPAIADQLIWSVDIAADGTVWATTHGAGVLRYEPAKDRWTIYTAPEHFPYPNARVLTVAPDGAPWVHIGYDHVYRFDGQAWRAAYESGGGQWVCVITFDAAALPWIATCGGFHAYGCGLAHFNGEQWIYADASAGLPDNEITAVAIAPDGTVAAGSDRGVAVARDGQWQMLRFGPTLSRVTAVVALPDGSATFGFGESGSHPAGGGLARYDAHGWSYEGGTHGLPEDASVHLLSLSRSGEIWAAGGCGLYRRSAEHWETLATCEQIQGPIIAVAFDPLGAAWIGTPFALYRYDSEGLRVFEGLSAIALAVDLDGTVWELADPLNGGALMTYDGATWQDRTADVPGTPERLLTANGDGVVLMGLQEGGLARHDGATWRRVTQADGLPFEHVALLAPAADGVLWAASGSSVARLVNGAWQRYDIPTPGINALSPIPNGWLWLATDSGAFLLKP